MSREGRTLGGRGLANTCDWKHAMDEVLTAAADDKTGVAPYTHSAVGHRTVKTTTTVKCKLQYLYSKEPHCSCTHKNSIYKERLLTHKKSMKRGDLPQLPSLYAWPSGQVWQHS